MKSLFLTGAVTTALFASAFTAAVAGPTQTFTQTFGPSTTNFTNVPLSLTQFDPSLGTLNSIDFGLTGNIISSVKAESLDAAPATITATASGNVVLTGPSSTLISVTPSLAAPTFSASAFDGVIDFGGTSGKNFGTITASANGTSTGDTNAADLAYFTGTGSANLFVSANASSAATGAGNLIAQIATQGSGSAFVVYNYTPKVVPPSTPEPATNASLALGGLGLLGLMLRARKTRRANGSVA